MGFFSMTKTELRQAGFVIVGLGIIMVVISLMEIPQPLHALGGVFIGMGLIILSTELGKYQLPNQLI